jgi:hypothetical protein
MADIGVFTKETAKELLAAYRQLKSSGLLAPGVLQSLIRGRPEFTEEPKKFTNISGDLIPPYACMQVVGTETIGGQTFLQVDKPADVDGIAGPYIFNWHYAVEPTRQGVAQKHRIVRAYSAGGDATAGDKWQPVVGDWTIEQDDGGQFTMCGEDVPASDVHAIPVVKIAIGGGGGGSGASIEGTLVSIETAGTSSPYNGLVIATITVVVAPCDRPELIGTDVEVVDHSECVFDLTEEQLSGVWVWASEKIAESLAVGADLGTLTPCHWSADDRCCVAADSGA